jgi:diacylglycerol kinase family enzyme
MNVLILYNPNSTGDSEKNAKQLARQLRAEKVSVKTQATSHAGHGEEIAAKLAKQKTKTILISSSGDGGYHEVVNGALSQENSTLTVGVLPSGNANDHYSALGDGALVESILQNKVQAIDTIKVTATVNGKKWQRYAHSYVGIGVTANAAKRLTDERPNLFTEKWIVLHSLFSFSYVKLKEGKATRRYSSIIFGNIDRMSKVIKLSDDSSVRDGKFEMSAIRFHSKVRLLTYLMTAATVGLKHSESLKRFKFTTLRTLPIQLDGEVYLIDKNSPVTIESVKRNLRCIL